VELTDAEDVACRLAEAYAAGPDAAQSLLGSLYADEMELRHVPALPSDGMVAGARVREVNGQEAQAINGLLSDRSFGDVEIAVEGDLVRVAAVVTGTLADGKAVRLPTDLRLTVRGSRIVGLEHHMGEEAMKGWAEVAAAAGMKVPEAFES
jgi:ketosteroid isomerase-like protein